MRFASMARLRAGPGVGPLFVAPLFFDNASRRVASRPNSGTACATGGRGPLDRLCRRDAPLATRDSKREQASKQARSAARSQARRRRAEATGDSPGSVCLQEDVAAAWRVAVCGQQQPQQPAQNDEQLWRGSGRRAVVQLQFAARRELWFEGGDGLLRVKPCIRAPA